MALLLVHLSFGSADTHTINFRTERTGEFKLLSEGNTVYSNDMDALNKRTSLLTD